MVLWRKHLFRVPVVSKGLFMEKLNSILNRILEYSLMFLLASLVILVFTQVVFRIFERSFIWIEELGRYLFVWLVFLGSAFAVNKGAHLGIDILISRLPDRKRRRATLALSGLLILFFGILLYYSVKVYPVWSRKTSAALRIPMSLVFLSLPVSLVLKIIHLISRFFRSEVAR